MKQQILNDRQRSQFPSRHSDPSLEQLIQAKFGQVSHQGNQNDLMDLLSRGRHGQIHPLDQHIIQQDQLHGRQLPLGLRQRLEMEERAINPGWSLDEASQFHRNPVASNRAITIGFGPLDFFPNKLFLPRSISTFLTGTFPYKSDSNMVFMNLECCLLSGQCHCL